MTSKISSALRMLSLSNLAVKVTPCPMCGPSLLVKLRNHATGVRCARCGASAIHMSIAQTLHGLVADLCSKDVYEMSSRGAFFEHLQGRCKSLTFSEFYDDVEAGAYRGGVQCQDVQHLTYDSESFDLCTSTEVFEHVPDDFRGFRELSRVLRPGGLALLTVPITEMATTIERARISGGMVEHLLEPIFHGDRIRGQGGVLCFRDYAPDIVNRLLANGFADARIINPEDANWWGLGCGVILAKK
jgi:SAM-dependent methyltransferase